MAQEGILEVVLGLYTANPIVTLLQVINIVFAFAVALRLINYAVALKGKSLSIMLRYLAYAFLVIALIAIVRFLSPLPWFDWDIVEGIAMLVFLLISHYAISHLTETVQAYTAIRKRY